MVASTTDTDSVANQSRSRFRLYFELTRLHKFPLGNILIIWPCIWGLTMAARTFHMDVGTLALRTLMYTIGGTTLHSAACVINDICDRDLDRQVERTKNRPLATNEISVIGATALLFALTSTALYLLSFASRIAFWYGLVGIFPLHALYPLMKRWTWWPQAWLGLAMNWGLIVAWVDVSMRPPESHIWAFFFGTVCWTIVYDTIYACQDKRDDSKAGIKSTALLFGTRLRPILVAFTSVFLFCMVYSGMANGQGIPFFLVSCGGAVAYFTWQFMSWDDESTEDCGRKFAANGDMGYIVWAGLLVDYMLNQ